MTSKLNDTEARPHAWQNWLVKCQSKELSKVNNYASAGRRGIDRWHNINCAMFSYTLHPSMVVTVACTVAAYRIRGCHSHSDFTSNDCLLAWKCILLKRKGSHLLTILLKFNKHCPIGSPNTNFPPFGHFRLFVKLFSQVNPKLFGILFTCFGGGVGRSEGGTSTKIWDNARDHVENSRF